MTRDSEDDALEEYANMQYRLDGLDNTIRDLEVNLMGYSKKQGDEEDVLAKAHLGQVVGALESYLGHTLQRRTVIEDAIDVADAKYPGIGDFNQMPSSGRESKIHLVKSGGKK